MRLKIYPNPADFGLCGECSNSVTQRSGNLEGVYCSEVGTWIRRRIDECSAFQVKQKSPTWMLRRALYLVRRPVGQKTFWGKPKADPETEVKLVHESHLEPYERLG